MKLNRIAFIAAVAVCLLGACVAASASVIYVTDYGAGTIRRVPDGGGASALFASGLNKPEGIAFSPSGTLYVANQLTGVIDSVSATGVVTPFVTIPNAPGLGGLTFDPAGNLYVSIQAAGRVDRVTPAGVVSTYATAMGNPQGLGFDASGRLFIADYDFGRVHVVAAGGGVAMFFGIASYSQGLGVDAAGRVYAGLSSSGSISRFSSTGASLGTYGTLPTSNVRGITIDTAGTVFAAAGDSVYSFPTGGGAGSVYATGFTSPIYMAVQLPEPSSLTVLALSAPAMLRRRRNPRSR